MGTAHIVKVRMARYEHHFSHYPPSVLLGVDFCLGNISSHSQQCDCYGDLPPYVCWFTASNLF